MPITSAPTTSRPIHPTGQSAATLEALKIMEDVDRRIDHLKRDVLPPSPYLLRVRSAQTFHLTPEEQRQWIAGTPFEPGEEELQYMTFIRRDSHDTLLETVAGWDRSRDPTPPSKPPSRAGSTGQLKKITFNEYTKRKRLSDASAASKSESSDIMKSQSMASSAVSTPGGEQLPIETGLKDLPVDARRPGTSTSFTAVIDKTSPEQSQERERLAAPAADKGENHDGRQSQNNTVSTASSRGEPNDGQQSQNNTVSISSSQGKNNDGQPSRNNTVSTSSSQGTNNDGQQSQDKTIATSSSQGENNIGRQSQKNTISIPISSLRGQKRPLESEQEKPSVEAKKPRIDSSSAGRKKISLEEYRNRKRLAAVTAEQSDNSDGIKSQSMTPSATPAPHGEKRPLETEPDKAPVDAKKPRIEPSSSSTSRTVDPPKKIDPAANKGATAGAQSATHAPASAKSERPTANETRRDPPAKPKEAPAASKAEPEQSLKRRERPSDDPVRDQAKAKSQTKDASTSAPKRAGPTALPALKDLPRDALDSLRDLPRDFADQLARMVPGGGRRSDSSNTTRKVPPLLSPSLPPQTSRPSTAKKPDKLDTSAARAGSKRLPPLLSPTLPAHIEKKLKTSHPDKDKSQGTSSSDVQRRGPRGPDSSGAPGGSGRSGGSGSGSSRPSGGPSGSNNDKSSGRTTTPAGKGPAGKQAPAASKAAPASGAGGGVRERPSSSGLGGARLQLPASPPTNFFDYLRTVSHSPPIPPTPAARTDRAAASRAQQVLKLRYGEANQARVQGLLGERSSSARGAAASGPSDERTGARRGGEAGGRSTDEPRESGGARPGEKEGKARERAEEPSEGSSKRPPSTPTPKRRQPSPRPGSSTGKARPPVVTPSVGPAKVPPTELEAFWVAEYGKYTDLGRTIKHEAEAIFAARREGHLAANGGEVARGALLAVESLCCYLLAFQADEELRRLTKQSPDGTSTWTSVLPFFEYVASNVRAFGHLHGLCHQLAAVCVERVHPPQLEACRSNAALAKKLWADGAAALGSHDLLESFPETWARRARLPMVRTVEQITPAMYRPQPSAGLGFLAPLSSISTPLEAVPFALSVCREYAARERVRWESRLLF